MLSTGYIYDARYLRKCFSNLSIMTKYQSEKSKGVLKIQVKIVYDLYKTKRRKRNRKTLGKNIDMLCSYKTETKW